mmetsp:Transcript_734/g.2482  ORF Transcript_734/g.2482 Transcript_734/m.2482 type:complete len:337 (+) Transcript_734:876-1886(+)|eukprot:CAMPEP_0182914044 /NCGR_PEP_ID=MMETSP0034_2-20130328/38349_1 /TAXON_ID=156128 /ORGANISM="Nephroselmis pyriformis, Strain CCMP717" /LENGTH=336 /DNA_ID=CAMNT_0025050777 /DNA_START=84 /DNA_END=1094 /DNA_ORIENTATION=+
MGRSFQDLERLLRTTYRNVSEDMPAVIRLLREFIEDNEDPSVSPNFRSDVTDNLDAIVKLLKDPETENSDALILCLLKVMKILSRKQDNRLAMGRIGIHAILRHLHAPKNPKIAGEGANVVLNICYEKENVEAVLSCNGVQPLVSFLSSTDPDLQANAAGAIQSICFQEKGRLSVRDVGAIPSILNLLALDNVKVQMRAVGALHNMSSDPDSIRIIRRKDGIPKLIRLLRAPQPSICGSAAGALQNVSREVASREIIKSLGAVPLLADLLFGCDLQSQVCAAGALLNILGPELGEDIQGNKQRKAFGSIVSSCLAMAMVYEAIWDEAPQITASMLA